MEDMHARKTGAVIRASVLMAAECVPELDAAPACRTQQLRKMPSGWHSRFRTICSTSSGDASTLGKATGADRERDKPTHPAIIGIDASQERVNLLHRQALDALEPFGQRAAPLRSPGQLAIVAALLSRI